MMGRREGGQGQFFYALISRDCVAKLFCPSERAVDVAAKSPPQHRTRASKPRKVTRKKPAKNAMPSASERPFQSFLSVRYSEVHWPSGWSLRTSPDQIARLQISRESVHRLFQARRLLAQSSQCQVLRPLAPRCYICPRFSWVSSLCLMLRLFWLPRSGAGSIPDLSSSARPSSAAFARYAQGKQ